MSEFYNERIRKLAVQRTNAWLLEAIAYVLITVVILLFVALLFIPDDQLMIYLSFG